jgi:hypothetical protein
LGGGVTLGAGEERKRELAAEAVVREDRMLLIHASEALSY